MKNSPKPTKDDSVIRIGIDLGTTNSEVAISINDTVEVIKNAQQDEYTPSVFGIDRANNKVVGRKAYDKLYKGASNEEFVNNKAEVKRLMGSSETIHFDRLNIDLTPEEVSAEILKSLKEDVTRKYPDFSTIAAVITVPAYFSTLQAEATKRAGQFAGFKHVVLLAEPIAAAMAYGFDNTRDQNWLVYDLGGGTFDVALISSKDSILTVLGHSGDNFLGGKDFDLKIVDAIIKPAILEKFKFTNFDRSNEKYKSTFATLKAIGESAKIELSQYEKVTIEIEGIGTDDDGQEVYVSLTLDRNDFEDLIKPLVNKTIDLAKKTLKESGVLSSSIAKIVLVGGPTQIPFVRKSLEAAFSLTIDNSIDPLTVVARGASIYGLSQRIPQEIMLENHEKVESEKHVKLNYDSMTADDEQTVTGIIDELKDVSEDYFVQIQSDSGFYSSSKIKLRNGKFFDTVAIEQGRSNTYWIYLFDDAGNTIPLYPDSFLVTHGLTVSGAPIPHEVGVIYAKKGIDSGFQFAEICDPYFDKNSVPPLKETKTYKTIKKLTKGRDNELPIKVYEGDSGSAENVSVLTTLKIEGSKLPYDLPELTDIDITISIDESRTILVEAYIPSIELTLNARADKYAQLIDTKDLTRELEVQKERLKKVEKNVEPRDYSKLENTIDALEINVKNADLDTDDKNKAERDLKELKSDLDKIESDKEFPQIKDEFYTGVKEAYEAINTIKDEDEKSQAISQMKTLESEGDKSIKQNDKTMLVRINEQVTQTAIRALMTDSAVWIYWLSDIKSRKHELKNQVDGDYHIAKAEEAARKDDVEELQRHVRELLELMPDSVKEEITKDTSGITR
jgi:molecular chaperone DnaK